MQNGHDRIISGNGIKSWMKVFLKRHMFKNEAQNMNINLAITITVTIAKFRKFQMTKLTLFHRKMIYT